MSNQYSAGGGGGGGFAAGVSGTTTWSNTGTLTIDPGPPMATKEDIEVIHIRMDNPGMSRKDAVELHKMHKEMGVLDEQ